MKAYFINHEHEKNVHEILDSSMIFILSKIFDTTEIHMSHGMINCLTPLLHKLRTHNILFYPTYLYPHKGHIRELIAALYDIRLLLTAENNSVLYFSSINIFSIHALNILAGLVKSKRIIFNCHSDMELLTEKHLSGTFNIFPRIIRNFFYKAKIRDNVFFLVLGDNILRNIKCLLPDKQNKNFFSCIHPYYTSCGNDDFDCEKVEEKSISIGIVGSVSEEKGIKNIKDFANAIRNSKKQVKIYFISRIEDSSDIDSVEGLVNLNPENRFIPREDYNAMVKKMDFIYFPYPYGSYSLTASGAVFEAIINLKPIIAMHNHYFDGLFDKFGCMGILYSSYTEMLDKIDSLTHLDIALFSENERKATSMLHPSNLYKEFKTILQQMKII